MDLAYVLISLPENAVAVGGHPLLFGSVKLVGVKVVLVGGVEFDVAFLELVVEHVLEGRVLLFHHHKVAFVECFH